MPIDVGSHWPGPFPQATPCLAIHRRKTLAATIRRVRWSITRSEVPASAMRCSFLMSLPRYGALIAIAPCASERTGLVLLPGSARTQRGSSCIRKRPYVGLFLRPGRGGAFAAAAVQRCSLSQPNGRVRPISPEPISPPHRTLRRNDMCILLITLTGWQKQTTYRLSESALDGSLGLGL